jgi:hypothetical protein
MAVEARMEHQVAALLAGEVTDLLAVPLQRMEATGRCFAHCPDIYAAATWLLQSDRPRPGALVVLVESLRGDELRFFDFLARRWPDMPAIAVYAASVEDRRLEACRRRGVVVVAVTDLAAWFDGQGPVGALPQKSTPAVQAGEAVPSTVEPEAVPSGVTPLPAGPKPAHVSEPAQGVVQPELGSPIPHAGIEVDLDLPDELADLPELDELQVELAGPTEYEQDDLPPEEKGSDSEADLVDSDLAESEKNESFSEPEEQESDGSDEDLPTQIPLTPWSSRPRAERRPPRRRPARKGSGDSPSEDVRNVAPAPQTPAPLSEKPPVSPARSQPTRSWEHGLLTPEELRALLDDTADSDGAGEGRP